MEMMIRKKLPGLLYLVLTFHIAWPTSTQRLYAQQQESAAERIRQLDQAWANAVLKNDVSFFERVLHERYVRSSPGSVRGKVATIEVMKSGRLALQYSSINFQRSAVAIEDDTAVVSGEYKTTGRIAGRFQYVHVWVRSGETWLLLANHVLPIR